MPNVLSLRRKSNGETVKGEKLLALDEELCRHFGVEPRPGSWYLGWMGSIGFCLAFTEGFAKTRYVFTNPEDLAILDYLEEHFENVSYYVGGA